MMGAYSRELRLGDYGEEKMSAGGISSSPITLLSSGRNNIHRQPMKTLRTLHAVTGPLCRWGPAATPSGGDFDGVGPHARNETLDGAPERIRQRSRRHDQECNSEKHRGVAENPCLSFSLPAITR